MSCRRLQWQRLSCLSARPRPVLLLPRRPSSTVALVDEAARQPVPWLFMGEILLGVPLTVYAWKCALMVAFQRRTLYMSYLPIDARKATLKQYEPIMDGLDAEELIVRNGEVELHGILLRRPMAPEPDLVVVHLQGNAGTPLHRIPVFTSLFRSLRGRSYTLAIFCIAPRSYWTSTPSRLTEATLLSDHAAAIAHARTRFPHAKLVLHGHSLGGAAAAHLGADEGNGVDGVILEAAFTSVPDMVRALYPQKWLPYRYLTPFVFDRFDSIAAVRGWPRARPLLVMRCERDELVPREMAQELFDEARAREKRLVEVEGAVHQNGYRRKGWAEGVGAFLDRVVQGKSGEGK